MCSGLKECRATQSKIVILVLSVNHSNPALPSPAAINPCLQRPCHALATCAHTGPAKHVCACPTGHEGDGRVCSPVDPCQKDQAGCSAQTTRCVYDGPGVVSLTPDQCVRQARGRKSDPRSVCTRGPGNNKSDPRSVCVRGAGGHKSDPRSVCTRGPGL